jgi:hypothetical protein
MSDGVQQARLRRASLERFQDLLAVVRAYAEEAPPGTALALLPVISTLVSLQNEFELRTRRAK